MKPLLPALTAALASLAACASTGDGPPTPDEFRVVTKPPLSVPPEFSLRPPPAGSSVPAEVEAARSAAPVAFGTTLGKSASAAERALIAAADANAASMAIRTQLDYEQTRTVRKGPSVADRILFWRKDDPEDAAAAAEDNATGGAPVTVQKSGSGRIKLPGT